jgi:hypothetical protein
VNYEQARQIGPDGPAPGKWNWTNLNDGIQKAPYTVDPCAWPDYVRPPVDPMTATYVGGWAPTGRERCDHDTQEEAERHHWRYDLGKVQLTKLDLDALRQRARCDVPECPNWEDYRTRWPGGYVSDSLCEEHATHQTVVGLHPFAPGISEIHS